MGSIRELLVAACHPWRRGVHVGTDGTRLAHAQFLGEPAVRRSGSEPALTPISGIPTIRRSLPPRTDPVGPSPWLNCVCRKGAIYAHDACGA